MKDLLFIREVLMPPLLEGLMVTLRLIFYSIPFGLLMGIIIATGRVYGNRLISFLCRAYVVIFKGTPLLMLLFVIYFGLPSMGISFQPFTAAVIGFVICNGAYNSEYIRGAILSVRSGQLMAAEALGMTRKQAVISIILPQAMRRALPGISNEIIYLIKYSSLAYMLTCIELTGAGKIVASRYFKFTLVFLVIGAFYLALVTIAGRILGLLEKKLQIPGLIK
ncbi:MAG TPA: amino acid ABC transporter permease [Synergistales bacterium]|nr:amino acid ABC transporter permease [Synergistales bacterium]